MINSIMFLIIEKKLDITFAILMARHFAKNLGYQSAYGSSKDNL